MSIMIKLWSMARLVHHTKVLMCLKCAVYLCFSWNAVCGTV